MRFEKDGNALIVREGAECLRIEPWGKNALRLRSTQLTDFTGRNRALTETVEKGGAEIKIAERTATITNGRIRASKTTGDYFLLSKGEKVFKIVVHKATGAIECSLYTPEAEAEGEGD